MKNLILISLLLIGLGLKAAHFTDGISEKAKTEYNVLKSIESFDITYAVDSCDSNYFYQVDQVPLENVADLSPKVKPIETVNLQVWRNLQSHRQSKWDDERLCKNNLVEDIKAPPKR